MSSAPYIWSGSSDPRCICKIYADFQASTGEDLDAYYQRTGTVTQLVDRCANCTRVDIKPQESKCMCATYEEAVANNCKCLYLEELRVRTLAEQEYLLSDEYTRQQARAAMAGQSGQYQAPAPVEATKTPAPIPVEFVAGAVAGGGVTAALYEHSKETEPMCETREQARATNCGCAAHQEVADPMTAAIMKGTGMLAVLALAGTLAVLASGFVAVMAAVCGALYLAYQLRGPAMSVIVALLYVVSAPLRFFGGMVADGMAELQYEKAQTASLNTATTYNVVQPVLIEEKRTPILLPDNLRPASIGFDSAQPVFVNIPGRKATKSAMKMEAK